MSVDRVLFVHGYSVRQLKAYGQFPRLLSEQNFSNESILLSAFLSLDDQVTCDDVAAALEDQVSQIEARDASMRRTALVCHSTGAIVARRWILNRLARGRELPSHLITFAGANHGSTLAQLGRTIIARLFRNVVEQSSVGQGVLADLDYGSSFLWALNTEWLDAANTGRLDGLYCFSLGGDNHSPFEAEVFWQTHEAGSDSVVRVSGANLNYSRMEVDPETHPPQLRLVQLNKPMAHLILPGYTHDGIIGDVQKATDPPFAALLQALSVSDAATYKAIVNDWEARTQSWTTRRADQVNATIVFRLRDEGGRPITDNLILVQDPAGSAHGVSGSLQPHQPIQNAAEPSSVSFCVNYGQFMGTHPHKVHIEARSGSPAIDYQDVDYAAGDSVMALVRPNECTYIDVRLSRNVEKTYSVVQYGPNLDVNATWPPLPQSPQDRPGDSDTLLIAKQGQPPKTP